MTHLDEALALYQDDYMVNEARYTDWASAERERLLAIYLDAADRLASELLKCQGYDERTTWCERILARDRCWEHAYCLMMNAYAQGGDRARAHRVFERCVEVLGMDLRRTVRGDGRDLPATSGARPEGLALRVSPSRN